MSRLPRPSDHLSEIVLLGLIAAGVLGVMWRGLKLATSEAPFDPSAYLVVLTLIVGAIKERWTQRSVDRLGQHVADSAPTDRVVKTEVVNTSANPAQVEEARGSA